MNPYFIKKSIEDHKGEKVLIKIYGLRNKKENFVGYITEVYPKIFSVETSTGLKSISYSEIISGDVVISFI